MHALLTAFFNNNTLLLSCALGSGECSAIYPYIRDAYISKLKFIYRFVQYLRLQDILVAIKSNHFVFDS